MSDYKDTLTYASNITQPATIWTDSGCLTPTSTGNWNEFERYTPPECDMFINDVPVLRSIEELQAFKKKIEKGGDDMRYLYEVILVNPKNDAYYKDCIVARSETSALMKAYDATQFKNKMNETFVGSLEGIDFDDLKTSCRVLMEWKKEKSLKKAIETIKEAVE